MVGPFERERNTRIPEHSNIIEVDTPSAKFRIIYESHPLVHSPAEIGDVHAYVSELIVPMDFSDPTKAPPAIARRMQRFAERRGSRSNPTATEVSVAFEQRLRTLPQYLFDVVDQKESLLNAEHNVAILSVIQMAIATVAGGYAAANTITGKTFTRRGAIKTITGAALALKGGLTYAALRRGARAFDDHYQLSDYEKDLRAVSEWVNPETESLFLTYRNAIWAHKLQRITEQVGTPTGGTKPHIALQVGSEHTGLERMLRADPAKRLEYIRSMSRIFNRFFEIGGEGVLISPVARFEYSNVQNSWVPSPAISPYRDSDLEKIEQELRK